MTEAATAPATGFPYSDDFYEDPITDDGVDMIIAYASLPPLARVRKHILGDPAAPMNGISAALNAGIDHVTEGVQGVRFYNSYPGVPHFSGDWVDTITQPITQQQVPDEEELKNLSPEASLGGLIWPLPDGKWQHAHLMADGRVELEEQD